MPSLGQEAARVRVRPVPDDEALLLGALHLQSLRRDGVEPDPGPPSHVQAFAAAWRSRSADLPAWVAECDGQHVGLVLCRVPPLPLLGPGVPEVVALTCLGGSEEAVALALVRTVVTWFGRQGHLSVDVADDVRLPAAVLDAARADVLPRRRVSLPTRP
ncbi:hypothetical protein ACQE98_12655 [Ornithinimicrobium sp. W1679]|uniref:hypothetical protein n=1 Tax=unclassified Ornithinimicrobium TaxID=2615080 RepID=UPI003CF697DC